MVSRRGRSDPETGEKRTGLVCGHQELQRRVPQQVQKRHERDHPEVRAQPEPEPAQGRVDRAGGPAPVRDSGGPDVEDFRQDREAAGDAQRSVRPAARSETEDLAEVTATWVVEGCFRCCQVILMYYRAFLAAVTCSLHREI